ncbi:MAG TPA: RHS repeat-associated core domain-containing protein [Verrucomicrobiota bacterium]|nr:hypothetical protein [Verrucomicrobiales bacterium]HRI15583.1 RHS repeat-associated core domain-containing protein [Verrucomicrobiota bacterium]
MGINAHRLAATLAPDDYVTHIEHKRNGSFVTRLTYERGNGGEPSKIWYNDSTSGNWNAGETVTLSYPSGLRLSGEDWLSSNDLTYTYDAVGNRRTRAETTTATPPVTTTLTTTYDPGFQIYQVTGGSGTETYDYDNGGRSTYISRGGSSWTMTWTASDRLKTANRAGVTTTYAYDPAGRRTEAVKTGQTRRFIVGPTAGTDLEVIHAVTDGTTGLGAIKALYVYAGDQPIMRFTVNASTGALENPVYYLEDANGSVIAQVTAAGTTTRFRYDGFGVARVPSGYTDPAATSTFPAGAGGDFRFHGHWLEADTGFYHMRARDYDPVTGRFLSRDPVEGATTDPESYHPYIFANSNPHFYSDPTGAFTIVEINVSQAIESNLQSFKTYAVNQAKHEAIDAITDSFSRAAVRSISALFPGMGDLVEVMAGGDKSFTKGVKLEEHVLGAFCESVNERAGNIMRNIYMYPGIDPETGDARFPGVHCPMKGVPHQEGLIYPDFIFGQNDPTGPGLNSWLIGEVKLSGNSLYNQYHGKTGAGDKFSQFQGIINYAGKHTHTRTAVFVTFFSGNRGKLSAVGRLMQRDSIQKGVIFFSFR